MASGAKQPRRGLGRGLEALLGSTSQQTTPLYRLAVDQVKPNAFQPRRTFDEAAIDKLAESIVKQGLLQPINVRKIGPERYEIISGERRWRAVQRAGLTHITAQVLSLSERQSYVAALVENIQREDLNPVEEARAMRRLVDEFGLTHEEMAKSIGRSRTGVTNTLRLLKLTPEVLSMLVDGRIEAGHARALLGASSIQQVRLAETVCEQKLSVRQTERLLATRKPRLDANGKAGGPKPAQDPDTRLLMRTLSDQLGADVQIRPSGRGRGGRLSILYQNHDQLNGILARLRRRPKKPPAEGTH